MKRLIALLAALAVLGACNSETTPAAARLSGTYDMVLVGNLVFVTSADRNELRVLDLAATPRDFVRAPNPIEPLSIPVIERAVGLVKDLRYDENGAEASCPEPIDGKAPACYVYAYSAAAPSISIVGVEALKELLRLPTADKKPVSAVSAVGPSVDHPNTSVLYYATSSGTASTIYKVELPRPDQLEGATLTAQMVKVLDNQSVSALLALPRTVDFSQEQLVVATRKDQGKSGETFVLVGENRTSTLSFPYPVRLLATHPQAQSSDQRLAARTRIFGVLDEEACGSSRACRGILAADVATGEISKDLTGRPMLPIVPAQGLLLSLSLTAGKFVLVPNADLTTTGFSLLGMGAASDGKVFFFDAWSLTVIDADPTVADAPSVLLQDETGTSRDLPAGTGVLLGFVKAGEGVTHDENILVTYQGLIPEVSGFALAGFKLARADLVDRVRVEDIVVLYKPVMGVTQPCGEVQVSRAPTAADLTFETSPVPPTCADWTEYRIRASGTEPFTVVGNFSGYLRRIASNSSADILRMPYLRNGVTDPMDRAYNPARNPEGEALLLHIAMGEPDLNVKRDWRYVLNTASHYDPLFFAVDASTFTGFNLPTSVIQLPSEATVLVSYPSANGIIEFTPVLFGANQLNSRNIKVYQ